ncbi:MAG: sulfite exporter TauE/SafE family protein [Thiohalomonadaceae bacterium]
MTDTTLAMAFLAGLLGSGHCIGMCGGLVCAFFLRMGEGARGPFTYAAYHGARVLVYVTVGVLAGMLGLVLTSTGIVGKTQAVLQILAGLVVIVLGLDILGIGPWRLRWNFLPAAWLQGAVRIAATRPRTGAFAGGLVNGLMPCSLTLAMAVKATTAQGPLEGGLLMLAFGLGTFPSMLLVSVLLARLGAARRAQLLKVAALFVIALGVATVWQGARYFSVMKGLANW